MAWMQQAQCRNELGKFNQISNGNLSVSSVATCADENRGVAGKIFSSGKHGARPLRPVPSTIKTTVLPAAALDRRTFTTKERTFVTKARTSVMEVRTSTTKKGTSIAEVRTFATDLRTFATEVRTFTTNMGTFITEVLILATDMETSVVEVRTSAANFDQ